MISARAVEVLRSHNVSGWKIYGAKVFTAAEEPVQGYFGLGVIGRYKGRITFDARESSLIHHASPMGKQFPYFKGLRFDASNWDGSDIFVDTYGSGWILTSERVARLFNKYTVTNCSFQRIEDVELLAQESAIVRGA